MTDQVDQDVVLDEEIEEAHDPKNAEAQSVASVDAAEKKGPKAKGRKGDKSNSQPSELKAAGKAMKAEDVDFDGDIDVLTFHISGEYLQYHQNQSQELYGHSDSLIFKLKNVSDVFYIPIL